MTRPQRVAFEKTAELSLATCENFLLDTLELPLPRVETISRHLVTSSLERLATHPQTYPVYKISQGSAQDGTHSEQEVLVPVIDTVH